MWRQRGAWRGDRPFGIAAPRCAEDDRLGGTGMTPALRDTVSAITYSLIREECAEDDPAAGFFHNAVARFVLEQRDRMPALLRLPMVFLTLAFDARAILTSGRPFHRLSHEQRWLQIERWRDSRLDACTNFIRFHRGLVLYGWYAMLEERDREE
jgi:hypothetical protein